MRIAAVVILYHCHEQELANINCYYDYVDKLFVYDNTETASVLVNEAFLACYPKITYLHDGYNKGIACRLNEGAEKAIEAGYDWLLTMDQDSFFSKEAMACYLDGLQQYPFKERAAMIGTRYGRADETSFPGLQAVETDNLITSGALLNLRLFSAIGGFDENLFIDYVDHEYCARSIMKGYAVVVFQNIYLQHAIGKEVHRSSLKTLFLVKKTKLVHTPLRCYYIYRNMLYLQKKYRYTNPSFAKKIHQLGMANLEKILFYGRNFTQAVRYLRLAIGDFKKQRLGKICKEL